MKVTATMYVLWQNQCGLSDWLGWRGMLFCGGLGLGDPVVDGLVRSGGGQSGQSSESMEVKWWKGGGEVVLVGRVN